MLDLCLGEGSNETRINAKKALFAIDSAYNRNKDTF